MDHNSENPQIEVVEATPDALDTTANDAVENEASEDQEQPEPRVFTQEELDKIVSAEKAKAERKVRRELAEKVNAPRPMVEPDPKDFATQSDYLRAAATYMAEQIVAEKETKKQQEAVRNSYDDREEAVRAKYSDYEDVALLDTDKGGPAISNQMAEVIMESEIGPEIAYYLGKNVEESKRIWAMKPLAQAAALGKIEATLAAKPAVKHTSSAPEPIKPVGSRSTNPSVSTADPRSVKAMSTSEWIEAENKRRAKLSR